jgi:hypothetical protein
VISVGSFGASAVMRRDRDEAPRHNFNIDVVQFATPSQHARGRLRMATRDVRAGQTHSLLKTRHDALCEARRPWKPSARESFDGGLALLVRGHAHGRSAGDVACASPAVWGTNPKHWRGRRARRRIARRLMQFRAAGHRSHCEHKHGLPHGRGSYLVVAGTAGHSVSMGGQTRSDLTLATENRCTSAQWGAA